MLPEAGLMKQADMAGGSLNGTVSRACEMVQQAKGLASKPDDLSSSPVLGGGW